VVDFADRVTLVTGASGNLGAAAAHGFRAAGSHLILVGSSEERLATMVAGLGAGPGGVLTVPADLTDAESVAGLVAQAVARFGRIDILVNAVGGYRAGTPVHETPEEAWDFMLDLNARTTFLTSRAVIPQMLEQGSGKIVNVAARAAMRGTANAAAYVASKAVVVRLTESMAAELMGHGINVNCILPGTIDTPQNRDAMPNVDHSRWVTPEDIGAVILFLASEAARAVHGAAVPVYGLS